MDLIVHIGLGKTGTTTLQQVHFARLPGYLGREDLLGARKRDARLGQSYRRAAEGRDVDMVAWRENIIDRFRVAGRDLPEQVVISQERLSAWSVAGSSLSPITGRLSDGRRKPRRAPHPFAAFLERHLIPAWEPLGKVRVLVTVRNQSDWLGSHYAQLSNRIIGAGQADFERQVRWTLSSDDAFLDYAELVEALGTVLGPRAVTVLLLEDIGAPHYWEALSELVGERLPKEDVVESRKNRRSTEEGWALRPYNRGKYPLRVSFFGQERTPGHPSMWTLKGVWSPRNVVRTLIRPRGVSIRMDDELRADIRSHFRTSNARLGKHLGRDLTPLGY